jgi:hypothetical protein
MLASLAQQLLDSLERRPGFRAQRRPLVSALRLPEDSLTRTQHLVHPADSSPISVVRRPAVGSPRSSRPLAGLVTFDQ